MLSKDVVVRWLDDAELEYEEPGLVQQPEDYEWALTFQGGAFRTAIAQHKVDFTNVEMRVALGVAPNHMEALAALSDMERERFMFDLRICLLQQPVGYSLTVDDDTGILQGMSFGVNLMEEPVQRSGFFRRNHQLQSTAILASQILQKLATFGDWR